MCCTLSDADPYALLAGYYEAQEEVDGVFKTCPHTAPMACNDLVVQYPLASLRS